MAVRIRFEFFGSTQVDRTLAGLERVADMRPAWAALRRRFLATERRQFSTHGTAGGQRWSPLSPGYGAWKAANYPGRPILVRDGELRESLTSGPQIAIEELGYAVFGSAVPHGAYHQHGTDRMPARPPIAFGEAERREWVRIIQNFIVTGRT